MEGPLYILLLCVLENFHNTKFRLEWQIRRVKDAVRPNR